MTAFIVPPAGVGPSRASVVALIAHARQVPSAAREAFAAELAALEPSEATLVVHTCHRVELYVALDSFGERPLPQPPPGAQRLEDADAARHLTSVACGLDSAVLGENQILHQLRETLTARRAARPLDPVLDRLFQIALHAGRRAHGWFNGSQRSLADVALERIEERAGSPDGRPILVVGAGIMGRLAALAAERRGAQVIVTNRTDERAAALAREVGGRTIPFAGDGVLPQVAGAIVALGGIWRVCVDDARRLAESGAIVVDLSSPAAVAGALQAQLGDRFVSADDLAWGDGVELQDGLRDRLERLVSESGGRYCHWLRSRYAVPAIQAMAEAAEEQRRSELEWLSRRLPDLEEEERSLIEQMSHRLVAGILHAPRSALNSDESGDLGRAARELFGV